jgi:DNA-binding beta-propeller fold protein YncE
LGSAVVAIDTRSNTILATLPASGANSVAISPDNNTIYLATAGAVTVYKFAEAQPSAISALSRSAATIPSSRKPPPPPRRR